MFPVREVLFSCSDASISFERRGGEKTFDDFSYDANIPYAVVLGLCFALPAFIVSTAS